MHAKEAKKMTEKYLSDEVAFGKEMKKVFDGIEYRSVEGFYNSTIRSSSVFIKKIKHLLKERGYRVNSWKLCGYLEISWKNPK